MFIIVITALACSKASVSGGFQADCHICLLFGYYPPQNLSKVPA